MSFMNGRTTMIPDEHKAQLRTLRTDQIDRVRYPLAPPTAQLSLDDRARLQYAQMNGKPFKRRAETTRPHKQDEGLNNGFLVVFILMLVPIMYLTLMWFEHLKPPQ